MDELIILVDEQNRETGFGEKLNIHKKGLLHRAFSLFVFNNRGELLLQKRNKNKYHSGGLWTNTCCSHPRKGEELPLAIHRRLGEEMGFDCELTHAFDFRYQVTFENGLIENEYDLVFVGFFDGIPKPDKTEAESFRWVKLETVKKDVTKNPHAYTYWFQKILKEKFSNLLRTSSTLSL